MTILGVDLGTTNSLAVVYKEGKPVLIPNAYGEYVTPSAVSILDGKIVVGKLAKERLITHPECSASLFKRNMGTDVTYALDKKEYDSATLSSFVVKQLIEDAQNYLHESIDEVVISVPAYFNARQRQDTKRIGELLGIKVERLINEPSAAAIACHMDDEYETFVVFDFGGGTLDVSVVDCFENVISINAISGNNHLGGTDFDRAMTEYFCFKNGLNYNVLDSSFQQSILRACEQAKIKLSTQFEDDEDMDAFLHKPLYFKEPEWFHDLTHEEIVQLNCVFEQYEPVLGSLIERKNVYINVNGTVQIDDKIYHLSEPKICEFFYEIKINW